MVPFKALLSVSFPHERFFGCWFAASWLNLGCYSGMVFSLPIEKDCEFYASGRVEYVEINLMSLKALEESQTTALSIF
jgi:hypothetical protein